VFDTLDELFAIARKTEANRMASDLYRCKPCNRVRGRIQRFKSAYEDLAFGFTQLDSSSRQDFITRANNQFGEDLRRLLEECITQNYTKRQSSTFTAAGVFMDMADLEEK
jgi:hypothetical protein